MDWQSIVLPSAPLPELALRGTVTYLVLFLLLRVVGRRESGGIGVTDVLVVVLVANAATVGLVGDGQSLADGFLLVLVILFWSVVIDALSYRFPAVSRLLKAGPRVLIDDGRLNRHTMRREFMTHDEVMSLLRIHGIKDPSEVHRAYLEPNGTISIITQQEAGEPGGSEASS
ncbi:MAG TPA: YetF domain-containing protein [Citricoccus sp.]